MAIGDILEKKSAKKVFVAVSVFSGIVVGVAAAAITTSSVLYFAPISPLFSKLLKVLTSIEMSASVPPFLTPMTTAFGRRRPAGISLGSTGTGG